MTWFNASANILAGATARGAEAAIVAAPQQAPTAAPGPGFIAGGTALVIVVLGFYLHNLVKHKKHKIPPLMASFAMGVLLAGSVVGVFTSQAAGTAGQQLTQLFTSVTAPGGGSGNGGTGTGNGGNGGTGNGYTPYPSGR